MVSGVDNSRVTTIGASAGKYRANCASSYLGLSEIVILSGVLTALAPASNARKAATALCIA